MGSDIRSMKIKSAKGRRFILPPAVRRDARKGLVLVHSVNLDRGCSGVVFRRREIRITHGLCRPARAVLFSSEKSGKRITKWVRFAHGSGRRDPVVVVRPGGLKHGEWKAYILA